MPPLGASATHCETSAFPQQVPPQQRNTNAHGDDERAALSARTRNHTLGTRCNPGGRDQNRCPENWAWLRYAVNQTRLVSTLRARADIPRCRTVRLPTGGIAPLAGNAAERISCISSRYAGCAWRQAASCQRPSPTTSRRIEGTTTHSGSASSAACVLSVITGLMRTMPRAPRSARTAPLPTLITPGTGQAKGVYSLTRTLQRAFHGPFTPVVQKCLANRSKA